MAYFDGGDGPAVLFLHGWGLSHVSYRVPLVRLSRAGVRVLAPSQPGFGSTHLAAGEFSLGGYARWLIDFLDAVGQRDPVTVVGHSFGGGVAIALAKHAPERVGRLVLVNSIGGSSWADGAGVLRAIRERPPWDWGLHLYNDARAARQLARVVPVLVLDILTNLLGNPAGVTRVLSLARTADLRSDLEDLKQARLPVVIVWGRRDRVLPAASLAALRLALGDPQVIEVSGRHNWLISDSRSFAEVITNIVHGPLPVDRAADALDGPGDAA